MVDQQLIGRAWEFADDLTKRVASIVDTDAEFSVIARSSDTNVIIGSIDDQNLLVSIPLTINDQHRLNLRVKYHCCWDARSRFLAVEKSFYHVYVKPSGGREPEVLYRVEYLRQVKPSVPASHMQIHAHRDEFTFFLIHADRKSRAAERDKRGKIPRIADFHFPTGGHRFRPCLEDVLENLIVEFGVKPRDGWRAAVNAGREDFRIRQLKTVVRDRPQEAAEALRGLGYTVEPPEEGHPPRPEPDKFLAY